MKIDEMQLETDNTGGHSQRRDGGNLRSHLQQGNLWHAAVDGNIDGDLMEDGNVPEEEEEIVLFEGNKELILTDIPYAFDCDFEEIRIKDVRTVG